MLDVVDAAGLGVRPEVAGEALSDAAGSEDAPFELEFRHVGRSLSGDESAGRCEEEGRREKGWARGAGSSVGATCEESAGFEQRSHEGPREMATAALMEVASSTSVFTMELNDWPPSKSLAHESSPAISTSIDQSCRSAGQKIVRSGKWYPFGSYTNCYSLLCRMWQAHY